jgi:hypothetical protein
MLCFLFLNFKNLLRAAIAVHIGITSEGISIVFPCMEGEFSLLPLRVTNPQVIVMNLNYVCVFIYCDMVMV